jgi:hypothetical protein
MRHRRVLAAAAAILLMILCWHGSIDRASRPENKDKQCANRHHVLLAHVLVPCARYLSGTHNYNSPEQRLGTTADPSLSGWLSDSKREQRVQKCSGNCFQESKLWLINRALLI